MSARIPVLVGAAAAAGAVVLLGGIVDGSVVVATVLVLTARYGPVAADPSGARAASRQVGLVPAWVAIAAVAAVRAGSVGLQDVRGANAIAGLAIARGDAALVLAAWLALAAGIVAISTASGGRPGLRVDPVLSGLDVLAAVLQVVLLITLFAGPTVGGGADAVPWIVGSLAAGGGALVLTRAAWIERSDAVVAVLAGAAVVAVLAGGRL